MSRPIRILVSGSRDWKDRPTIALAISSYLRSVGTSISGAYPFPVVVHGAARGADRLADEIALGWGWTPERHPVTSADWDRFGRSAGHRRNRLMVELGADVLLAFPLGESKGTRGCMKLARAAGIPVPDPLKLIARIEGVNH